MKQHVSGQAQPKKPVKEGGSTDNKSEDDKENNKFKDQLSGAIVVEKPNVKWSDVAGLDQGVINDPGFTAGQHLKVDQR